LSLSVGSIGKTGTGSRRTQIDLERSVHRRIVITGGAGFIGTTVAQRLAGAAEEILAIDSLHPQVHKVPGRPARLPDGVELWPFDVTAPNPWDALFKLERPSVIVHLAAETGTGQSLREATRHGSVNVVGTTQMLDALARAEHVPEQIILASSRAVYGEGAWSIDGELCYPGGRTHEDLAAGRWDPRTADGAAGVPVPAEASWTRAEPTNVYAATKLAQEHILRAWTAAMGCSLTVLRFQNVYGVGQSLDNPYTGVLSIFTRQALSGEAINVYEDGAIVRDFVYVDDVADSVIASIAEPPAGSRTLDVGSGRAATILEVAGMIAEEADAPEPRVSGAFRDGDVRAASCAVDEARAAIGYDPKWSLREGIAALVAGSREILEAT
jgi:dTDP-L-rhamnose 4-epimerase